MGVGARDSRDQEEPKRLIFKLCGSIERLVIDDPQEWLGEFAAANNERENRIARRLALCPETHSLRFHLAGEDCDDTRPFDDLNEVFKLGDFLDRVIFLHTAQRATSVSRDNGQLETIVVDYPGEQVVDRSKQSSKAKTKRGHDRPDELSGNKATSSKSVDHGHTSTRSHGIAENRNPSNAQGQTLADSQKPVKHKPAPVTDGKAPRTAHSDKNHQESYSTRDKPFKSENKTREAKIRKTQDALKEAGEARHASRNQPRKDPDGARLEKHTMLGQKTLVSEGKKSGKEGQNVSATEKGKKPTGEQGGVGVAPKPPTTPRLKKRKEEKITSDSDYVNDGESGGQSPKKKPKIDRASGKSKVGKKAR
ncbi:hypothetical protein KC343_g8506 [Hortaea werneckii]|nr:hypothetical protein KC352_g16489 [Hortaea werneckii]KAI7561891.1 hypothetical protein KC317_g8778 [Hortaea werneckii]KAI7611175.1 hypothetical protein KC346_g8421 [Hortaea werneckii]KAI7619998.1 hypothetical protein KC343_g8506 [Hortaea werneckii]KAI7661863.1 hypothetical protein KC319_g8290 [Hortaea werneckii]